MNRRAGQRALSIALGGAAAAVVLLWATPAATATLESRLPTCSACHGATGQSSTPEVPSLGGQPSFYLSVQMLMFRDRLRAVDVMNEQMLGLTNDELQKLADLIGKQPPPKPVAGGDKARFDAGRVLAEQNRCNFCHNASYQGERNVPRIAAQREDYLVKALREYKSNARRGYDASMADVLYGVSDAQILDLAYFLARYRR